jgi:hypothetical protein
MLTDRGSMLCNSEVTEMIRSILLVLAVAALAACQTTSAKFNSFEAHNLSEVMKSACLPHIGNIDRIEDSARNWIVEGPKKERFMLAGKLEQYTTYSLGDGKRQYGGLTIVGDGYGCGVNFIKQDETVALILAEIGAQMNPKRTDDKTWLGIIEPLELAIIVGEEPTRGGVYSSVSVFNSDLVNKLRTKSENHRFIPQ